MFLILLITSEGNYIGQMLQAAAAAAHVNLQHVQGVANFLCLWYTTVCSLQFADGLNAMLHVCFWHIRCTFHGDV